MKQKTLIPLLFLSILLLSGCSSPNRLQLDLSQGFSSHFKLLHLNVVQQENQERILAFQALTEGAQALDRPTSTFAYYPDYLLEIKNTDGDELTILVDVNGRYVDFMYPGPYPVQDDVIYRSAMTPDQLTVLIHQES